MIPSARCVTAIPPQRRKRARSDYETGILDEPVTSRRAPNSRASRLRIPVRGVRIEIITPFRHPLDDHCPPRKSETLPQAVRAAGSGRRPRRGHVATARCKSGEVFECSNEGAGPGSITHAQRFLRHDNPVMPLREALARPARFASACPTMRSSARRIDAYRLCRPSTGCELCRAYCPLDALRCACGAIWSSADSERAPQHSSAAIRPRAVHASAAGSAPATARQRRRAASTRHWRLPVSRAVDPTKCVKPGARLCVPVSQSVRRSRWPPLLTRCADVTQPSLWACDPRLNQRRGFGSSRHLAAGSPRNRAADADCARAGPHVLLTPRDDFSTRSKRRSGDDRARHGAESARTRPGVHSSVSLEAVRCSGGSRAQLGRARTSSPSTRRTCWELPSARGSIDRGISKHCVAEPPRIPAPSAGSQRHNNIG